MRKPQLNSIFGDSPGKIALAGVLTVVFVAVLVVQFGPGAATETAASDESADRQQDDSPDNPAAADAERELARKQADRPPWPEMELESVLRHDPFAMPAAIAAVVEPPQQVAAASAEPEQSGDEERRRREEALRKTLDELRARGVSMIVRNEEGSVAAIGDRVIRVGDEVEGFRVADITPSGVVLEIAESQP